MPVTATILLDVAVILVAARAGGVLFERFGQPSVIGEIAAGIALGPTLLGVLPGDPSSELFPADALAVLQLIGQLGLVLFMFTVGWDLDLKVVRRREGAAATVSIASILLPFAFGLALAAHLHPGHDTVAGAAVPFWPFALFLGASLSLTAFPVLARILQETGLARRRSGRSCSPPPPSTTWSAGACSRSRWPCSHRAARGITCASWPRSRCSSPWSSSSCGRCCTACCSTRHRGERRWCCRSRSPARMRRTRSASTPSSERSSSAQRCRARTGSTRSRSSAVACPP